MTSGIISKQTYKSSGCWALMRIWKFVHYNNDSGDALCMPIALRTAIPIARLHDIPGGEYTDYVKFDAQVQEKRRSPSENGSAFSTRLQPCIQL